LHIGAVVDADPARNEAQIDMKILYANYKNIGLKHKRIFDGQGNCRLHRFMAPVI
jgi:hypothetical protein